MMFLETNGAGIAHEGVYVPALVEAAGRWHGRTDEFADTVKIALLFGQYTFGRYGGRYYAKAQNLRRRLRTAYDAALASYDLLLMPATVMKAQPIPGPNAPPEEITRRSWEATRNTCPFNATGHPAISIPCGMEDERPIGVMLVGRHWDEATIYRAAAAFERSGDWRTF
jgi:amidase